MVNYKQITYKQADITPGMLYICYDKLQTNYLQTSRCHSRDVIYLLW